MNCMEPRSLLNRLQMNREIAKVMTLKAKARIFVKISEKRAPEKITHIPPMIGNQISMLKNRISSPIYKFFLYTIILKIRGCLVREQNLMHEYNQKEDQPKYHREGVMI